MAIQTYQPNQTDLAANLMREFAQLESVRQNWESYWADIARRIHPNANIFGRSIFGNSAAERRTEWIFESTAPLALDSFAAVMEAMLVPRTSKWSKLAPTDPGMAEDQEVRRYLEGINDILFTARYSAEANFASNAHECFKDLGAFGNTSLFVDEAVGSHLQYRAIPLQDLYFAANHVGIIDRVFRKFAFSATQAAEEWGVDKLPASVSNALNTPGQEHREFEFLHAVRPRKAPEYGNKTYRGMPLESFYVGVQDRVIVEESGYQTMPYATSRYTLSPREVYGRSPAMLALADIKMLNEMSRTDINASQLQVQPPVLLGEAGRSFGMRPGYLNYDMVTNDGKPLAIPFNTGARVDIAEEKMQKRRESIDKAFLVGLMQFIMSHPDMPVANMLQLAQERGMLLTPAMGRQQAEFLGPIIARELDILGRAGQFDDLGPPPRKLIAMGPHGPFVMTKIEYSSPLNQMQKAAEGVGILQTFQQLEPLALNGHPEVFDIFEPEKTARKLFDINGGPADVLRSKDEFAGIQQQKADAAKIQALIAGGAEAASAAKDLATAHSTVQNVPQPVGAQA